MLRVITPPAAAARFLLSDCLGGLAASSFIIRPLSQACRQARAGVAVHTKKYEERHERACGQCQNSRLFPVPPPVRLNLRRSIYSVHLPHSLREAEEGR